MLGILLIDKPAGITSHDVVNRVRRRFNTRRVGHSGTLDPMATGLLVIAVGPATRFLQYLPLEPKEYVGTFAFGRTTETFDAEGATTTESEVPANLVEQIEQHLPTFRGLIQQVPPMYSAVKLNGKALYTYARKGEDIEREPRTVHISEFALLASDGIHAEFRIRCSGGTYVRTLGHDLGQAIGCGAHMTKLTRTEVGRFKLDSSLDLDGIMPNDLISLRDALVPAPMIELDEKQVQSIREGRTVMVVDPPEGPFVALLTPEGNVFSIARVIGNVVQPDCVIPEGVDLD